MTGELNPPDLAEAINARGFTGAAGVRIVAVTPGLPRGKIGVTVELKVNFLSPADGIELIARARTLKMSGSIGVATVEVFSRIDTSETLCAFCTATMRALDLPRELQQSQGLNP